MNEQLIKSVLIEENYPDYMLAKTIEKINNLNPLIKDAFERWVTSGENPVICIEAYTVERLENEYGMKPVGAFLTLDWLVRNPENAKRALQKGYR